MLLTTDKPATKAILLAAGLPTPAWLPEPRPGRDDEVIGGAGPGPWLIKPARGDASIGIDESDLHLVSDPGAVRETIATLPASPRGWFAERYVHGREFNLSLLEEEAGPRVLPVAEMRFLDYPDDRPRVVGYRAKWDPSSFEWSHMERSFHHAPEDAELVEALRGLALASWDLLRLRGYARVDFRVDEHGAPWILEVNTNPGIAPDAGFAAAALQDGLQYGELLERIVRAAR